MSNPYGNRLRYGMDDALIGALLNPRPRTPGNILRGLGYLICLRDALDPEAMGVFDRYLEELVVIGSVGVLLPAGCYWCSHCDEVTDHSTENCPLPIVAG